MWFEFDDLASNALSSVANPVKTPYDGLAYSSFDARAKDLSIVRAHCLNNTAASNTLNEMLAGNVSTITSKYTGSKVSHFDLISTYLGCAVTTETSSGLPQSSIEQFSDTKTDGMRVSATCYYAGTVAILMLVLCEFSLLKSVQTLSAMPISSETLPTLTVVFIDNVVLTLFSKS